MSLTPMRETFAQAIADGLSQADAYRRAFDASKSKPETIYSKASALMADGKVLARVAELRCALATKALWTRERSVTVLANIAVDAETRPSDKTAAIKELNAMHGFNAPTVIEGSLTFTAIERKIVNPSN